MLTKAPYPSTFTCFFSAFNQQHQNVVRCETFRLKLEDNNHVKYVSRMQFCFISVPTVCSADYYDSNKFWFLEHGKIVRIKSVLVL
ncbi:hypothetical protein CDAR_307581 [Caerostris darwini]|uniref:Uncharacterized protein n=1 Tax=Caerostris darwini TaxID=1538125 RepID=A0AAV4VG66_9ARAC|nr:hypothetical protein CDAR_307581 [Caerostris darwini]